MIPNNDKLIKVLYICLEFSHWHQARSWSYQTGLGLEEGLKANNVELVTVPALYGLEPDDPGSWLSHIKAITSGKKFDHVWVELVHNNLSDAILNYLATLAPVRLGIIGESLTYPEEVYTQAPHLRNRQSEVFHRLQYMTHALLADELDVERVHYATSVKAMWWVQGIPSWAISVTETATVYKEAFFSGSAYGERNAWLNHPTLSGLMHKQQPLEQDAGYPVLFDKTNAIAVRQLRNTLTYSPKLLDDHLNQLRILRKNCFSLWLKGLAYGSAVVNLPSFFQGYAGRVYEGIAAGRPVISWEIPNRPKTQALFENGKEILLFEHDNPAKLAEYIRQITEAPVFTEQVASNARTKLKKFHTIELRVRQILEWIATENEPIYHEAEIKAVASDLHNSFYVDLWNHPAWSSPYPNLDEEARWIKISEQLNRYKIEYGRNRQIPFRILDVGCGRGWLSRFLNDYGEYTGIEPVAGATEIARKHFPNKNFIAGYTSDLIKASVERFDIIVSTEVIEHVPYESQLAFLNDIYELLLDGGILVLTTPRKEIFDYISTRGFSPQPVEDWLTEAELEQLVTSTGLVRYGKERLWYDADTGAFDQNSSIEFITSQRQIALYQIWSFIKKDQNLVSGLIVSVEPLVSVIVPTYNRPDMLRETIQSVLNQTFTNFEIVVVNDAGQDVQEITNSFNDHRIRYIAHETNKGLAAARNTGIRAAKGKYIAYLDDDDIYYPEHLEVLVNYLENNPQYKVAYTDAYRAFQEKSEVSYQITGRDLPLSHDFDYNVIMVHNFVPVLCFMHHRECLDHAGYFDESLTTHEDWDLWIRVSRIYKLHHIKQITAEYRWRTDGTTMTSAKTADFLKTLKIIYCKYSNLTESNQHILNAQAAFLKMLSEKIEPEPPLVSIIIPLFNQVEYTANCLEALFKHTFASLYELILVDNGSTDRTEELFDLLPATARVIRNKENLGFAKACNQGALAAKGKYLLFLNNDTVPLQNWLEPLIRILDTDPEVAAVGSKLLYADNTLQHAGVLVSNQYESGEQLCVGHVYRGDPADYPAANVACYYQVLTAACLMVRKDAFEAVNGFDEQYWNGFEDVDLCFKLGHAEWKLVYEPRSVLYHFESKSGPERYAKAIHNSELLYKRWQRVIRPDVVFQQDGSFVQVTGYPKEYKRK